MVGYITNVLRRGAPRCINSIGGRPLSLSLSLSRALALPVPLTPVQHLSRRSLHEDASTQHVSTEDASTQDASKQDASTQAEPATKQEETDPPQVSSFDPRWASFRQSLNFPKATAGGAFKAANIGQDIVVHGFLGKRRDKGSALTFCHVASKAADVQIISSWGEEGSLQHRAHQDLKAIPANSPVCVHGTLQRSERPSPYEGRPEMRPKAAWDLKLRSIQCLNPFPKDIIVSKDTVWPPNQRHLQIRFDPLLQDRLYFRESVTVKLRRTLQARGFMEVETPYLFKSTPEGAREFLVPCRQSGYAYALPQSPQQYKQILMAGGIHKYYQFAKCFRDEDHRADRQPEFTQLDVEMAFADGADVRAVVEKLVKRIFDLLHELYIPSQVNGVQHPVWRGYQDVAQIPKAMATTGVRAGERDNDALPENIPRYQNLKLRFPRMSYHRVMSIFGTDKPDLRIVPPHVTNITPVDSIVSQDFVKMITKLENPVVEACKFRLQGSVSENASFIQEFFETLSKTAQKLGPDSSPGVFVFDSSKPLQGLSSLGHEAAEQLASMENMQADCWPRCEDGDVIIIHARKNEPFQGGSTELGRIRKLVYDKAVASNLLPKDDRFRFLWVTEFPLFTSNEEDPGQGGAAGFSSTHHPFTAPATAEDLDLLATDPLKAKADHYDLVVNGIEVGGGSRRIHMADVQEYIMRDILQMTDDGVGQFSHLLEALRAGCPPHAGFAFGFDRLIAVLCDVPSVRDVMAFPKNNRGADPLVGSPSKITEAQQKTYHLSGGAGPTDGVTPEKTPGGGDDEATTTTTT